jgi:4-hydroxy-tetrahydrodipicolinate synthase
MSIGGVGVVSVVANIIPRDVADMCAAFEKGDVKKAEALHYKMLSLVKAMFIETNPIPVKTAMAMMKMLEPGLRLPLCEMMPENKAKLEKELREYKLI